MPFNPEWQPLVDKKRQDLRAQIPPEWILPKHITDMVNHTSTSSAFDLLQSTSLLTPKEKEITENYTAAALIRLMSQSELTSLEVTTAFCKRAAIAQQLTNCLTEIFFERALSRAKQCDEYLAREKKPIGPLHGLPISLKDMLMVEGEAACLGFVSFLKKPVATSNSFIVDMLLDAGAVLYVKTNVPQTLFTCESYNNVFGHTMNPYNLSLTAGGSSSGEGAIVGFRGALLGVGSDIGGSVRVPALVNGAYGFKPSSNRLPWGGQQELIPKGWLGTLPTLGPLAVSAEDLTLFMKTLLLAKPWVRDSTAHAIAWRDIPTKPKLRIGLYMGDPIAPLHPPVKRALRLAADKLKAAGHEVVVLDRVPSLLDAAKVIIRGFELDTEHAVQKMLSDAGEQPIQPLIDAAQSPVLEKSDGFDLSDAWRFQAEREDYTEQWGKVWRDNSLDVLLGPGYKGVGARHDHVGPPHYTMVWNLVDFPASVIPFEKVDASVDTEEVLGFNVNDFKGVPAHVQVVGWRFQDEEVLMATEIISKVLA
ncbi:amidase signature domain-containing protein [Paraphoma chrysanthemicola]|nr:amidase signature domain-containing protein [Paraphoma chrysanthemicola]